MSEGMNKDKFLKGRLTQALSDLSQSFNASVHFDKQLAPFDIQGSIAHATMLSEQGIISEADKTQIIQGLSEIQQQIEQNQFDWQEALEDVHMNIEAALIGRIGDAGKRLHTARSRNDQVATDLRLYLRTEIDTVTTHICQVQDCLLSVAEANAATIMPGFTHLQTAQPVTFGHHLMAWFEMLQRDKQRFADCRKRTNQLPLGAAALAGTSYPINRLRTAELLNFDGVCRNSLDAVSDRDFAIEFLQSATLMMNHLSRMAEELIIWNSQPFSLVELADDVCTGSSIMPQKKNPDILELIRGKSARVFAAANSLLMLMKAQPLSYNKDNQEDKEPLFDTVNTLKNCLQLFAVVISTLSVNEKKMYSLAAEGFATATDLADYLVGKGLTFRDAYRVVGEVVRVAMQQRCDLSELPLTTLQKIEPNIQQDVFSRITLEGSVNARNHIGGTAPEQVLQAVAFYREQRKLEE